MPDYWIDGYHVSAEHEEDARAWVQMLHGKQNDAAKSPAERDEEGA